MKVHGLEDKISSPIVAETAPSGTRGLKAPLGSTRGVLAASTRIISQINATAPTALTIAGRKREVAPLTPRQIAAVTSRPRRRPGKERAVVMRAIRLGNARSDAS